MLPKDDVSIDYLQGNFYLDDSGNVRNLIKRRGNSPRNAISGRIHFSNARNPYRKIGVDNREYRAHRIAFALHHGRWPVGILDHDNHDGLLNHPDNLIESTNSLNHLNRPTETGIHAWAGGWYCRLIEGQVTRCSEIFPTVEQAREFKKSAEFVLAGLSFDRVAA